MGLVIIGILSAPSVLLKTHTRRKAEKKNYKKYHCPHVVGGGRRRAGSCMRRKQASGLAAP